MNAISLIIFYFLNTSYSPPSSLNNDVVRKITVSYSVFQAQLLNENAVSNDNTAAHLIALKDSFSIYYYNQYSIYEINNRKVFQSNNKIDSVKSDFIYVITKRDTPYCWWFNSFHTFLPEKKNTDSFIKSNALANADFYDSANSILHKQTNIDSSQLLKIYTVKKNPADTQIDTAKYYFTKHLPAIEFSFSRTLERDTKMKLYKVEFAFSEPAGQVNEAHAQPKVMRFEMWEKKVDNAAEIIFFTKNWERLFND